jgi:DnaJ like chaperone protein
MGGYGKWIGLVLGGIIGRGLLGAVVGFIIGHLFDRASAPRPARDAPGPLRERFFTTTFEVMGHVAKADGRVTEREIDAARATMRRFALGEAQSRRAIECFTTGKDAAYPLEERVRELRDAAEGRTDLCRTFLLIQLEAALQGGGLDAPARERLLRVAAALGIGQAEFMAVEAMLRMRAAAAAAGGNGYANDGARGGAASAPGQSLADAYELLGVPPGIGDAELTLAYRRLLSQNHPDKLVANGLPESMVAAAHERTRQIISAYETVKRARGMP